MRLNKPKPYATDPWRRKKRGVGRPDREERHQTRARDKRGRDPAHRVPQRRVGRRRRRFVLVERRDLRARQQVAERVFEHGADVGAALPGKSPDVDFELDGVGDHIRLGATVHDRRGKGGVCTGVRLAGEPDRQLLAEVGEGGFVEEAFVPLGPEVDAFDEATPRLVNVRRGPVLGETFHDLGRGDEGVVGAERLRSMARAFPAR